jgi:hypothetical protein
MGTVKQDIEKLKNVAQLDTESKAELLKSLAKINLLTPDHANAKTAKNAQFSQYESVILHLAPADMAFKAISRIGSLCPMASDGCKSSCLNTAGRGRFTSIQESRLRKTLFYILFRDVFMSQLEKQLAKLEKKVSKKNKQLVVRLNGTSDIAWENIKMGQSANVFERFSMVQFYDYTKIVKRLDKVQLIKNYYVIFSASESNSDHARIALRQGFNVAMVFNQIPERYKGHDVLNGDAHDFRFLDPKRGVIVGLKAKGKAQKDTSGFVRQVSQCGTPAAKAA